ncbi:hypothetical protein BDV18DRAFT_11858 [Aspergillus unguis]
MRGTLRLGLAAGWLFTSLVPAVLGQECNGPFTLNLQGDLEELLNGCTTIIGDIIIENTFDGTFNLSGVTNITGSITTPFNPIQQDTLSLMSNVTFFDAPELLSIGTLDLDALPYATGISLPKLEAVTEVLRINATRYLLENDGMEVDVPAIVEVPSLILEGTFSRMDFASLEKVTEELRVNLCSGDSCHHRSTPTSLTPLAVSFPVLESAGLLNVTGAIPSISFPELVSVGPRSNSPTTQSGLILDSWSTIDVYLPKLSSASLVFIDGHTESLSMPSFQHTNGSIYIRSSEPLGVQLPLIEAGAIFLTGKIESAMFPNLTAFERISITSNDINCTSFLDRLDQSPVGGDDSSTGKVSCKQGEDIISLVDDLLDGDDTADASSGQDTDDDLSGGGGLDETGRILVGIFVPFGTLAVIGLSIACCCGGCCTPVHAQKTRIPEDGCELDDPVSRMATTTALTEGPIRRDEISAELPPRPSISPSRSSSPPPPYSPREP